MSQLGQTRKSGDAIMTSALPPTADIPDSGCDVQKPAQKGKSHSFDRLVATGEHLAAIVIRAARLAAILLRIARCLRRAKGPARL